VHIFLSFINNTRSYIHLHLPTKRRRRKKIEKILYVLMITMMIYMLYTLLPLEKFNNEMQSPMPTIGEIEAGGENERERDRERMSKT
jgi:hypothetical protein